MITPSERLFEIEQRIDAKVDSMVARVATYAARTLAGFLILTLGFGVAWGIQQQKVIQHDKDIERIEAQGSQPLRQMESRLAALSSELTATRELLNEVRDELRRRPR